MAQQNKTVQKKITIKQFEWFEVETKVRELLTQLLQPFVKKQTEDTLKIIDMKRLVTSLEDKVQNHDFFLKQEGGSKPTYIEIQDEKIEKIQKKFDQLKVIQSHDINQMRKVLQIYENRVKQINDIETEIQKEVALRIKENQTHKQYVNGQIDRMLKKLQTQDDQIHNFKGTTRNAVTKMQKTALVMENKVSDLEMELNRSVKQIRRINEDLTRLHEKTQTHSVKVEDLTNRVSNREKDERLSQKFFGIALQLGNDISFLKNFLIFYQPLYVQTQISETLHSFLKGTSRARLCLFEEKIFSQMHYKILATQSDSLETLMSEFSDRIRRILNKNKKYVIKFKINQTVKLGTNIYEIREIDEMMLERLDEQDSKPVPIVIPEQQIFRLVDGKWEKLIKSLEAKINEKLQPTKSWVQQLQDQSILRMIQSDKKIEEVRKQLEKQQANFTLVNLDIKTLQSDSLEQLQKIQNVIAENKESIKQLISFGSVLNHIVIQDQIDRQGMALYALKSKNTNDKNVNPSIRLDEKCMTCSDPGSSSVLNQAFKMACLAYNPSQIRIQDKEYSRQEILEISTSILERLKANKVAKYDEPVIEQAKRRSKSSLQKTRVDRQWGQKPSFRTIESRSKKRSVKQVLGNLPNLGAIGRKKIMAKTSNNFSVFY